MLTRNCCNDVGCRDEYFFFEYKGVSGDETQKLTLSFWDHDLIGADDFMG